MSDIDRDASVDELEQDFVACERLIARLRMRQARTLQILDVRQVNHMDGARSMQEWVRARADVSDDTARDLVQVARRLPEQPDLAGMAEEGRVSFDRAVATSRLIAAGVDEETVAASFGFDLRGVARLGYRRRRITKQDEVGIFANRFVYTQDSLDGSRGRTVLDLPGPAIGKAQRLADAAVSIAQDSLDGYEIDEPAPRSDPIATVLVDAAIAGATRGEAGAEIAYGHRVGPATLEKILCTGRVQMVGLDNGRPVRYSDATHSIPPAVRRFVAWRDGGCVIDGCRSHYRLQVHHIRHRSDGGSNDPDNLATLCWFHHHVVVHGLGLRIDPDSPPQLRRFLRAVATGCDPPGG